MMAYITRLSIIKKALTSLPPDTIIITERSIFTDREIFAKMLYDDNKIESIEYQIYLRWFNEFKTINLDGIIYVQTLPGVCNERIGIRNRKGESTINMEYIKECDRYHENWINSTDIPVLVMDGQPEQSEYTIEQIKEFIKRI
jgi:deoxyadenosine/deoxycytidine kinase